MRSMMIAVVLVAMTVLVGAPVAQSQTTTLENTEVAYQLPYPGMLPDHPFYFLKSWRDNLQLFFAGDSRSKCTQYLDQADKQIAMAHPILKKGKVSLTIDTVEAADKAFGQAIEQAKEIEDDQTRGQIRDRMQAAIVRHRQEIENLMKDAPQDQISTLDQLHGQTEQRQEEIEQL